MSARPDVVPEKLSQMRQQRMKMFFVFVLLTSVYFVTGKLALALASINAGATAIWPPAGIALAAILIWGYRVWPAVPLGAFLIYVTTLESIPAALMLAAGNAIETLIGAYLVNRLARGRAVFERARDVFKFVLFAVLLSTAVCATVGTVALVLNGLATWDEYRGIAVFCMLSNATSILILTPPIVLWANSGLRWSRGRIWEAALLLMLLVILGRVVFDGVTFIGVLNYPVQFLVVPLVLWYSFRFGPREVATATLILMGIGLWGTLNGFGPYARFTPAESLALLQSSMSVLATTSLALAALVSEHNRSEESQRWLATIVESSNDAIIGKTLDGTILSWNHGAEVMFGYRSAEIIGKPVSVLVPPYRLDEMPQLLERIRRGERIEHYETYGRRKDGRRINVSLTISPIKDARGVIHGASTIARDITDRRRAEERIRFLAQHDALTGLPNRVLFGDRISQAVTHARRNREQLAVLFLDLDGFKHINDSLGHQVGDRLLRMAAKRLQRCLRDGDSVARLGGDEFVINLPALAESGDAMVIAGKVLESLREPFNIDQHELHVTGSIGISVFPTDGDDAETLMRAADTAMYYAKEKGRNNYQFFTPRLNEAAQRRLIIANRLHQAWQRGELILDYQPQVDLESGRIFATEALLRWRQPELGPVVPGEFIKVAEETGLIAPIGEWVLRQACEQIKRWRRAGYSDLRVAVNLSPQQFRRPGFPDIVAGILHESKLPPTVLEMEITEGVLMTQSVENIAILEQLAATGVRLAVDDFGTGYSSLSYLQRFPVHTLKIDRSFVDGIGADEHDTAIVTAIIAMAHSLRLKVVAEGVETANQVEFLRTHGCLAAQGFYYGKPVPAQAFGEMLGRA